MNYLLDTNTVSEPTRLRPNAGVMAWLEAQPLERLHLSVITIGELQRGVLNAPDAVRRARLRHWYEHQMLPGYVNRVLDVTPAVMAEWAQRFHAARSTGRTPAVLDSLIAATAAAHGLTVVTRNEADFAPMNVPTLNIWTD